MHLEVGVWGSFFCSVVFGGFVWFLRDLCFNGLFPLPPLFSVARSICFRARFGVTMPVTDRVF